MAVSLNVCMCVLFHCKNLYMCVFMVKKVIMCIQLYNVKCINYVTLNKKQICLFVELNLGLC